MEYSELIARLSDCADDGYAAFQKKLLKNDSVQVMGVRIPVLRALAKEYQSRQREIFLFPDTFYEVVFLKLAQVARLPYEEMLEYVDACVAKMDNWATCDCFAPKSVKRHRDEFLPYLEGYIGAKKEFSQRFALVCLLQNYVEPAYYDKIEEFLSLADCRYYYVHMAAAWLTAEVVIKDRAAGIALLQKGILPSRTQNKAIQKARESYRLQPWEKAELLRLKK